MPFEEKPVAHQMFTASGEVHFFRSQLNFTMLGK